MQASKQAGQTDKPNELAHLGVFHVSFQGEIGSNYTPASPQPESHFLHNGVQRPRLSTNWTIGVSTCLVAKRGPKVPWMWWLHLLRTHWVTPNNCARNPTSSQVVKLQWISPSINPKMAPKTENRVTNLGWERTLSGELLRSPIPWGRRNKLFWR